ncbi:hypothetical protein STEG23_006007 [Scotinomys teguina]
MAYQCQNSITRRYIIMDTIGQGSFGLVKLAYHRLTGTLVAIKTVKNRGENHHFILREVEILQRLQHPNIIQLFEVIVTTPKTYSVLEFVQKEDLWVQVKDKGRLPEDEAQKIFGQIVSALKYCHDHDIVHRNLKPKNILLDEEGNVKLTDFGLATTCRAGTLLKEICGTMIFNAPEKVLREAYDGRKGDVWSLGVLLFYITTGYHPFEGSTMEETVRNITTASYSIPDHISGQLENLIHQMLMVAPERRPSIENIQQHPWVPDCEETFTNDIYPDPNILDELRDLGFDTCNVLQSLLGKKYDEYMGIYLLLKEKARKRRESELGHTNSPESVDSIVVLPSLSPVQSSVSSLYLNQSTSEPTFGLFHTQSSQQHLPVVPTAPEQKVASSVSMPLCFPLKSPTCSCTPGSRAASVPDVCNTILGGNMPPSPAPDADIVEENMPPSTGPDSNVGEASAPRNTGFFKRLRKRLRACLSRWCCCFPCAENTRARSTTFTNKVAPQ